MQEERERMGVPQKRQNKGKNGTNCGESATGPGGLPRARTSREFLLRSASSRIQCTRAALHRREQNQATQDLSYSSLSHSLADLEVWQKMEDDMHVLLASDI